MRRHPCPLAALSLAALCLTARPVLGAPLDRDAARAVADVLACERPDGGWTYVCDPPAGPWGAATKIVQHATRIAGWFAGGPLQRPPDRRRRAADASRLALGLADWDLLVLRSPGTPAAGLVLLDAYRASGDPRVLAAARRAGNILVATQLSSGGWASEMPVYGARLAWWFRLLNR